MALLLVLACLHTFMFLELGSLTLCCDRLDLAQVWALRLGLGSMIIFRVLSSLWLGSQGWAAIRLGMLRQFSLEMVRFSTNSLIRGSLGLVSEDRD